MFLFPCPFLLLDVCNKFAKVCTFIFAQCIWHVTFWCTADQILITCVFFSAGNEMFFFLGIKLFTAGRASGGGARLWVPLYKDWQWLTALSLLCLDLAHLPHWLDYWLRGSCFQWFSTFSTGQASGGWARLWVPVHKHWQWLTALSMLCLARLPLTRLAGEVHVLNLWFSTFSGSGPTDRKKRFALES